MTTENVLPDEDPVVTDDYINGKYLYRICMDPASVYAWVIAPDGVSALRESMSVEYWGEGCDDQIVFTVELMKVDEVLNVDLEGDDGVQTKTAAEWANYKEVGCLCFSEY